MNSAREMMRIAECGFLQHYEGVINSSCFRFSRGVASIQSKYGNASAPRSADNRARSGKDNF
jgi:hypothetical protein